MVHVTDTSGVSISHLILFFQNVFKLLDVARLEGRTVERTGQVEGVDVVAIRGHRHPSETNKQTNTLFTTVWSSSTNGKCQKSKSKYLNLSDMGNVLVMFERSRDKNDYSIKCVVQ